MTARDRLLLIAYAVGFAMVTTAYLGHVWPGGPGSLVGAGLTGLALLALRGQRWNP